MLTFGSPLLGTIPIPTTNGIKKLNLSKALRSPHRVTKVCHNAFSAGAPSSWIVPVTHHRQSRHPKSITPIFLSSQAPEQPGLHCENPWA